jgi:hypothetical protein
MSTQWDTSIRLGADEIFVGHLAMAVHAALIGCPNYGMNGSDLDLRGECVFTLGLARPFPELVNSEKMRGP